MMMMMFYIRVSVGNCLAMNGTGISVAFIEVLQVPALLTHGICHAAQHLFCATMCACL
jgi:hypothetical protein